MKKDQEYIMDGLIAVYLMGEATEAEKQQVQEWVNDDPLNQKHFDELKLVWEQSKEIPQDYSIDIDRSWAKFQQKVEEEPRRKAIPLYNWARAAAVLLLLGAGSLLMYNYWIKDNNKPAISSVIKDYPALVPDSSPVEKENTKVASESELQGNADIATTEKEESIAAVKEKAKPGVITRKKNSNTKDETELITDDCHTKKYVCNSTPCPIEICIIQKGHCEGGKPLPIFNCSVIQPDESGRLCYGGVDENLYKDCAIAVQEIRIKRVSTGETIVLDQQSSPLTAQEVFSYISGQKKGDIVAGVFQNDCNDEPGAHSLTIENRYGSLLFK